MNLAFAWGFAASFLLTYYVLPLARIFFRYFISKRLYSKRSSLKQAGDWAIITGGSDGIGKAFACELAKDGINVMLLSFDRRQLEILSDDIRSNYHVDVKYLVVDFRKTNIYEEIEAEIDRLPSIACLINNVGIGTKTLVPFDDQQTYTFEYIREVITCNCISTAAMTRIVLPRLLKQGRPGAAIINTSSVAGMVAVPWFALYGATKSFMAHFARVLRSEVDNRIVTMQTFVPALVATKMTNITKTSFLVPSPQTFAASALDMLGVEPIGCGYFGHALYTWAVNSMPHFLYRLSAKRRMNRIKAAQSKTD